MSETDLLAVWLTLKLAASTTGILLLLSPPLAWWLSRSQHRLRPLVEALVALPLVLPPTVLGFYLLLAFSPEYGFGGWWQDTFGTPLAFSFLGLLFASVIYSLPFVVQPLTSAFVNMGNKELEAAATLGLGPLERFFHIILPMTLPSEIFARTDLSLASRDDASVMLEATLDHYDRGEQMASLRLGDQLLMVAMEHGPDESGPLQIKVAGRDVVIATAPIEHSSLSNCLETLTDPLIFRDSYSSKCAGI